MKFQIVSDLHLETGGVQELQKNWEIDAPVLLMAGDIVEIKLLNQHSTASNEVWKFLEFLSDSYEKVVWVCGNHEFYFNYFEHTIKNAKDYLIARGIHNTIVLENEILELDDTIIFGCTLWTSMGSENPTSMFAAASNMNDYHLIKKVDSWSEHTKLQVDDTVAVHKNSMVYLQKFLDLDTDAQKIVVTHHAPHVASISDRHVESVLVHAYYTDLFEPIWNTDVKLWVHGHIHEPTMYNINNTIVLSNPRGYFRYADHDYGPVTMEI